METIAQRCKYYCKLNALVDTTLAYGVKSSDMNFFDFGFGRVVSEEKRGGRVKKLREYALHVSCAISIVQNDGQSLVFYGDSRKEEFERTFLQFVGQTVIGISLGLDNALFLHFNNWRMEIVPADDGKESWRFFQPAEKTPHLIAADTWIN